MLAWAAPLFAEACPTWAVASPFPRRRGLGRLEVGVRLLQPDLVVARVQRHQRVTLADDLVVLDQNPGDVAPHLGQDRDDMPLDLGVVGGLVGSAVEPGPDPPECAGQGQGPQYGEGQPPAFWPWWLGNLGFGGGLRRTGG